MNAVRWGSRALAALATCAFVLPLGIVLSLSLSLVQHAAQAHRGAYELLAHALRESLLLGALSLPWSVLLGGLGALYWTEYREERWARLGERVAFALVRLPALFMAVALLALASPAARETRALQVLALCIPGSLFVATAAHRVLQPIVPVFRDTALALGVPRHRWMLTAARQVALRPLLGVLALTVGRLLTATAPLLVLAPTEARAPLTLQLLRTSEEARSTLAVLALALLALTALCRLTGTVLLRARPTPPRAPR